MKKIVHIVPHTHWDREWYLSFQHFRIRLTRMMKQLLHILDEDADYRSFHLDGQSIVLKDYLEIHPEDKERLHFHIASGRIKVGPWYVQPDEALVSAEALVRNFHMGITLADQFGGSQRFGYLPDMFGHISQMPQILDGFGIRQALFWRGLGQGAVDTPAETIWQGVDGTEIFAHRLTNQAAYSDLFRLHSDPERAAGQIRAAAEAYTALDASASVILLLIGVDHMDAQPDLSRILREAAPLLPEYELLHSTLEAYMEQLQQSVIARAVVPNRLIGEQRDVNRSPSGRINFLLPNVLSSRIYLKQRNAAAQTELERWAEPFSSVLTGLGGTYPAGLLYKSWEFLLQNHPHDSICGCSRDEVHRQMLTRFEWSQEISSQLAEEALHAISSHVDTSSVPEGHSIWHVYNAGEWRRGDAVEADLILPTDAPRFRTVAVFDAEGNALPAQVIDHVPSELRFVHHESTAVRDLAMLQDGLPVTERGILVGMEQTRRVRVLFQPSSLPAFGYATFTALPERKAMPAAESAAPAEPNVLENGHLRAEVNADGSIRLLHKASNRWYDRLLTYVSGGDVGDGYTFSPPLLDEVFSTRHSPASIVRMESGPVRSGIRIESNWNLPESIAADRQRRSASRIVCRMVTELRLGDKDEWLSVTTRFENNAKDHRLSVLLPSGIPAEKSWATGAFDIVERPVEVPPTEPDYWIEDAANVFPNHGLIGLSAKEAGLALAPCGLPEAEVSKEGTIRLTLLRAVGHLGSPDPLTIIAGAGPTFPTPEGQCLGEHTFRYAIIPHSGVTDAARIKALRLATEHRLPSRAVQQRRHSGTLPLSASFASFGDEETRLALSAVKKAWVRDTVVIRVFNPTTEAVNSELRWWQPLKAAYAVDLQERRSEQIQIDDKGGIPIYVGAKKVVSIELEI